MNPGTPVAGGLPRSAVDAAAADGELADAEAWRRLAGELTSTVGLLVSACVCLASGARSAREAGPCISGTFVACADALDPTPMAEAGPASLP